ncbi:putative bifunctional diguanylate cyclase/phosphodiesterase [Cohnella suwonensis]|uniref:Bifunctional diguanylate cyclase/phosphodiesterase n=1 Tax=Cohnella suwonensis TaxID=696072 RepID=A0ABW0M0V4_9BACL
MNAHLIPYLLLFLPSLLPLYLAMEIYLRNRENVLNRLTAICVATYGLMILGNFFNQTMPLDLAPFASRYIKYVATFVNLSAGLYFVLLFCKSRIRPALLHLTALPPMAGIACLLSGASEFGVAVLPGTVWRTEVRSDGLALVLALFTLYATAVYITHLALALRRLKLKPWLAEERKRVRLFLWAVALTMVSIAVLQFVLKPLPWSNPYVDFDLLSSYPTLFYCWAFRYAVLRYDFLSSTDSRYKVLFNRSPIGISIFNDQGMLLDANSAYLRMLGIADLPDNKWRNSPIRNYAAYEDNGDAVRQMNEAFRDKRPLRLERLMTNRINESYFVDKSVSYFELDGEILAFAMTQDITAQKASEEKLAFLANHDPLTRLGNRRWFYEKLTKELNRLQETDKMLAVLLIDLDHFKWINDSLGHHAGDELLCSVAERFAEVVPDNGCLTRLGGDEFALLLPGLCSEYEAEAFARELIVKLRGAFILSGRHFQITASVGISLAPRDGSDAEELLRNADTAMYSSKKEGRDRYGKFQPQQRMAAEQTNILINGLKSALEKDEFTLHYQSQFELRTGRLIGVEALLRWHSAELGPVPPGNFIPIAEETGAIIPIGEWVLRSAIEQGKRWIQSGLPELLLSVNVSPRQLQDRQFAGLLAVMLMEQDFPAGNLCLEITESYAIEDMEQSLQVCREIVGLGVKLALDDFGIGYSSLGMLSRFPFRTVKIDKSLIRDIDSNPYDADVVQTIVKLSGNKGMEVLAEGVETEWQMELLRRFGCHSVQGYLLGRPVPAAEFGKAHLLGRGERE